MPRGERRGAARPARRRPAQLATAAALLLVIGCGWRSPEEMQRDYAKALRPTEVAPSGAAAQGPVRTFRVRLYADAEYQAQTLRWREKLQAQLDRANRVLEPQFGVRLEAESVRTWPGPVPSADLSRALEALLALDPATDVDWVIGFVPSIESFAAADRNLGYAPYFGRHLVLRAMNSRDEADAVGGALDLLSPDERDDLVRELRAHRETAVLLHEWAHTLGAIHERAPQWLMSPQYGPRGARFSPESAQLVALGLRYRRATAAADRDAWESGFQAVLERSAQAWDAAAREDGLAGARAFFGRWRAAEREAAAAPPPAAPSPPRAALPCPAVDLRARPRLEPAPTAAPPVAAPPPGEQGASDARGLERACFAALDRAPRGAATADACRAAADAPGARAEPMVALAAVLLDRADPAGAVRALARAERAAAGRSLPPPAWAQLAQLYARVGACTAAERAAERAGAHREVVEVQADCARVRREVGLAAGQGIDAEREQEYVTAVRKGLEEVLAGRPERALEQARHLERAFPATAGPALVTCLARAKQQDRAATTAACERAVSAAPDAVPPRRALGAVAFADGRWDDAAAQLRRAIELGETSSEAWSTLAASYDRLGDAAQASALRARYEARFGVPLRAR